MAKPSSALRRSATRARSGWYSRRRLSIFTAIFFRPDRVSRQTRSKLDRLQKFCVMAVESSRFSTACHQPPGTKTVSPGPCAGGGGGARAAACVLCVHERGS